MPKNNQTTAQRTAIATRSGTSGAPQIAASRLLAAEIEAVAPPAELARRLDMVARGLDFELGPDGKPARGSTPPDWPTRWKALNTMIERQLGKMKSHVVLEGDAANPISAVIDHAITTTVLDGRDYVEILGDEVDDFREKERRLIAAAKAKVAALQAKRDELDARAIDARSVVVE